VIPPNTTAQQPGDSCC